MKRFDYKTFQRKILLAELNELGEGRAGASNSHSALWSV